MSKHQANGVANTDLNPAVFRLVRSDFSSDSVSLFDLPFVAHEKVAPRKKRASYWSVPHTDDYGAACSMGRQYAGDFVQMLKDNPSFAGTNCIGHFVKEMATIQQGHPMRGYEVGFFSSLEVMLYRAACREDHWQVLQSVQDCYNAITQPSG